MSLKWNGKGFVPNIPARDLTDDEVKLYGEAALLQTGIYEKPAEHKPAARKVKLEDGE